METNLVPLQQTQDPPCAHEAAVSKGYYARKCDSKRVKRFFCKACGVSFSQQTSKDTYRHRVVREVPLLKLLLCSGVSQRRAALILRISRGTVTRKVELLSNRATEFQEEFVRSYGPIKSFQFDEMQSFEHTKAKPLSIPLIVTPARHILAIGVASMPANGRLAEISRKKYGPRRDDRPLIISKLLSALSPLAVSQCDILTDQNPHYVHYLAMAFPNGLHRTVPGGRGTSGGFGEMKKKGFDPLFSLNHTAAMVRDGLATLKRRTWTTAKKAENLAKLLMIYTWYHNEVLVGI